MCGIVGTLGYIPSKSISQRLIESLHHRGPDFASSWSSGDSQFPVFLGHTRLSILDLSVAGNQPMSDITGEWVIVFNGEIYNFLELKKDLIDKGVTFRTDTDTEVFLYGLIIYGLSFQMKCNGMWAFCLWNTKTQVGYFGRDRFGKKPLYFLENSKGLAFASEMKTLYPLMSQVELSEDIDFFFKNPFNSEARTETIVNGITKLLPGHCAIWKKGSFVSSRWWCTLDHLVEVPEKYDDQVEQFRELFLSAVKLRLRADVKIGTALSGGLDSSCTLLAMSYLNNLGSLGNRSASDWQHAVSCEFPGSSINESAWAKYVADYAGIPIHLIPINPVNCEWSLKDSLWQVEDPYITPPMPMLATYREISKLGIKVTLDGHGADELFSGYGHISSAIHDASFDQLMEILKIQSELKGMTVDITRLVAIKEYTKFISKSYMRGLYRKINNLENIKFNDQNHPNYKKLDSMSKSLYEVFHITILPTLLRNYDRYSMASGVEVRMPFLDHRIVSFCFSLPWTSKLGGGYTKRILRDAMKGIVPEKVRLRKDKLGWNAPLHEWFDNDYAPILALLENQYPKNKKLIMAIQKFRKLDKKNFEDGEILWAIIQPFIWKNNFTNHIGINDKN
jgi:asparagine synthase (glutamine-hydrolysing)